MMNHPFRIYPVALIVMLIMASQGEACPDCTLKNSGGVIEPQTVMAKLAFSASTLLLISILFMVLAFMIYSMVKACRDLGKERPLSTLDGHNGAV
jgi:hypothetical protein